jgi:hypothetical protein
MRRPMKNMQATMMKKMMMFCHMMGLLDLGLG